MRIAERARDLVASARDLASHGFGPGPDAIRTLGSLHLHRGLAAALGGLGVALVIAGIFRALRPEPDPELVWYVYEFNDRRWLVLGYGLAVAALTCAPLLAMRDRAYWSLSSAGADATPQALAARIAIALAAYTLWLGPPWNTALLERPMEWHELVHLGPIQAVLLGKDFYLESGTQYGPGMQMLSVRALEHFGVSLGTFRAFWLWGNFAGGLLLVAWMARLFPLPAVLVGLFALRFFSPFGFFEPTADGSYGFFYGWATTLRYAGSLHAVLALGSVLARPPRPDMSLTSGERLFLFASGIVFGAFALMAQENTSGGIVGCGLLGVFAWLTRAASPARLASIAGVFAAGALLGAAPLLLPFVAAGEVGSFFTRYFAVGSDVAAGYSNVPFGGSLLSPAGILYVGAPIAAIALFAVAAFDGERSRHWRMTAAAVAAAALAGHVPTLLRSDEAHILAMVTPTAFVFAAACAGLQRRGLRPASATALVIVLLPLLFATRPHHLSRLARDVRGRVAAFSAPAPKNVAEARIGYAYDPDRPYAVFTEMPLTEFVDVTRRLHEIVGGRPVVVSSAVGSTGHWYFFANLLPLMPDPEPMMTVHNNRLRARHLAAMDARGIPCVVARRLEDPEMVLFRRQSGARDEWIVDTSEGPLFVGCLRDEDQPSEAQSAGSSERSPIT